MNRKNSDKNERTPESENRFLFKSILVSNCDEVDDTGKKNYRTVYPQRITAELFVDIELVNISYGEAWDAVIKAELLQINGDKAISILQRSDNLTVTGEAGMVSHSFLFSAVDLPEKQFPVGKYVILIEVNGERVQTDHLFLIEGNGNPESYFSLLKAGIDKVVEETEEETRQRPHSYRSLDRNALEDVRFYFMAENLLKEDSVYEFTVLLLNKNGMVKSRKLLRGDKFISDDHGKRFLFSAIDFGIDMPNFWKKGEYAVHLLAFDRLVLRLEFALADRDIAYDYQVEVQAGSGVIPRPVAQFPAEVPDRNSILDQLYKMVGLRKVKEEVTRICEYADFIRMRQDAGFDDVFPLTHMLFIGNLGTGKHTAASLMGELFHTLGFLSHGTPVVTDSKDLMSFPSGHEEAAVRDILTKNAGGVLYIEDLPAIMHSRASYERGVIFLSTLLEILTGESPEMLVIIAGTEEEMNLLTDSLPDLKHVFSKQLYFPDCTPDELMEIMQQKIERMQYRLTPAAEDKFFKVLRRACVDKGHVFMNGHYIDEKLEEASAMLAKRLMSGRKRDYTREDMMLIQEEDICADEEDAEPNHSFEKVDLLIQGGHLKQRLIKHLNYIYFVRERQKQGFNDRLPALNMIFSGNPGTGRLTVAKMLGEIYYSAGILSTPEVVVQNGYNLTVENGVTPDRVASMLLNSAAGGMLYIENACSLAQSEAGLAVFEMILSALSPGEFNDIVVVLSDTPSELTLLLDKNPGIRSCFPYQFDFMDYTPEELTGIAENKLRENHYVLHKKAREALGKLVAGMSEMKDKYCGNAIWVEKLVGGIIRNMSERTMKIRQKRTLTRQELITVISEDIPLPEEKHFDWDSFDRKEIGTALKELDKMVGQEKIKKQVRDFVDIAAHYSGQGVRLNTKLSLQWYFTGNSGMGKKAVARIIARIYKAMGIIDKDAVFEFKAERLLGMTEEEALRLLGDVLFKSKGGILLFDEDARKLENTPGFRERVKAMLVNLMVEIAGSCMIIFVVPPMAIQELSADAERATDLVNILTFEDYADEELLLILKKKLKDERMVLSATAGRRMLGFISLLNGKEERKHSSARIMRIASELMIRNCLQRISKNDSSGQGKMIPVVVADVAMFDEEFIAGLINERKKIGFAKN